MVQSKNPKIIIIVGPTASGKSDLAIKLALKLNGEIISADSRQVYRGMDIGTGKVSKKEQKLIPHHIIDMVSPKKQFTADDFRKYGQKILNEIIKRGKLPIIVGGTGFYIDVLLGRIQTANVPPNKKLRTQFDKLTVEKLFERLQKLDPERVKTIDKHNKRRLIRALEIFQATKKSSLNTKYLPLNTGYEILWIGLKPKDLEKRIKTRLDKRLGQGMIKEVEKLHQQGVGWKRLDDFGLEYRFISRWLMKIQNLKIKDKNYNSKFKNSEEHQNLSREIVKYSKRQMTWFKRNKEINWMSDLKNAEKLVQDFLN